MCARESLFCVIRRVVSGFVLAVSLVLASSVEGQQLFQAIPGTPAPVAEGSFSTSLLRMIGALGFCIGILAVGVRLAGRFGRMPNRTTSRRMELREKIALSPKTALFLISVDNREYLVASGPENVTLTPTNSLINSQFAQSLHEVYEESKELHA